MCEMEECLPQASDFRLSPAGITEELWSPILGCLLLEPFSSSFSHLYPFKVRYFGMVEDVMVLCIPQPD